MENTFKTGYEPTPRFIEEDVMITPQERAIYNYVALKLAYHQSKAQSVVDQIRFKKERKLIRFNNIVTRSFTAAVLIAIVAILIKSAIK